MCGPRAGLLSEDFFAGEFDEGVASEDEHGLEFGVEEPDVRDAGGFSRISVGGSVRVTQTSGTRRRCRRLVCGGLRAMWLLRWRAPAAQVGERAVRWRARAGQEAYPTPRSSMRSNGVPHARQITPWQSPQTSGSVTGFSHFGQ